jgi:hypothetical protein
MNFGNVEADDLSRMIADKIEGYGNWTSAYNSRLHRAYFFPASQSECWTLYKPVMERGDKMSPWAKYTTNHAFGFQPTAVMTMLDPVSGLEYVFMGDAAGRIWRMEGTSDGDGSSAAVKAERLSKVFVLPLDAQMFDLEGWVQYRKGEAATLTLKFEYAGDSVFDETVTLSLPAATGGAYYNGSSYYGDAYYGIPFAGRLTRQPFTAAGQSNAVQVRATVEGTTDFQITEIGLRFKAAS